MGETKRVPLESDDAEHDTPFVGDTDHLRGQQDKSMQPHPDDEDAGETMREQPRSDREQRTVFNDSDASTTADADSARSGEQGGREYVEQEAVRMLKDTLREKGVSESFIRENEEKIRKKALDHLYGRDRDQDLR